jgi:RNA polymerase sigma-70 factor (ECF subfamily)
LRNHEYSASDTTLVAEARAGTRRAFEELVCRHSAQIYGVSFKLLGNREDAEDNLQNAFFKAYRKLHQFEGKSRFSTWLTRIAINEAMMTLRKRGTEKTAQQVNEDSSKGPSEIILEIRDSHADPEREYIARELAGKALNGLNQHLRDTFVLHKAEGWTHPDLAKAMGVDASTVKSRVFRARVKLRQQLHGFANAGSMTVSS